MLAHRHQAHAAMVLHTLIIGPGYTFVSWATSEIEPFTLLWLRFCFSFACFCAVYLALWQRFPTQRLTRADSWTFAWLALVGILANQFFFVAGLTYTTPTFSALIYALSPAGVFLWSVMLLKTERWLWGKILGLVIAFCGVGVVLAASFQPHASSTDKPLWLGNLLTACALVCWSWYLAASRPLMRRFNPMILTSLLMILGTAPYLVAGAWLPFQFDWPSVSAKAWFGLGYLVLVNSVAGYFLTMFAVTRITSSQTALYINLQPIVAMAFSSWYGGEHIPVQVFVGGFLVITGIFVLNWISLTR